MSSEKEPVVPWLQPFLTRASPALRTWLLAIPSARWADILIPIFLAEEKRLNTLLTRGRFELHGQGMGERAQHAEIAHMRDQKARAVSFVPQALIPTLETVWQGQAGHAWQVRAPKAPEGTLWRWVADQDIARGHAEFLKQSAATAAQQESERPARELEAKQAQILKLRPVWQDALRAAMKKKELPPDTTWIVLYFTEKGTFTGNFEKRVRTAASFVAENLHESWITRVPPPRGWD